MPSPVVAERSGPLPKKVLKAQRAEAVPRRKVRADNRMLQKFGEIMGGGAYGKK